MKARSSYVGIMVKDLGQSIDFYTRLLGMRVIGRFKLKETRGKGVNLVSNDSVSLSN